MGSFTVFGFTKSLTKLHEWSGRLGIIPRATDFGDWGYFFFYTSYGDVEETQEALALKLGFVRSLAGSPLSTKQLVVQKAITPRMIDHGALRGNALVACLGKTEASFSVYQTLMSAYQLVLGSVVLFLLATVFESPSVLVFSTPSLVLLAYLSFLSAAAFSLWYLLIRHSRLSSMAVYRFLIPVCAVLLSVALLESEHLSWAAVAALIMVCLGMVLTARE